MVPVFHTAIISALMTVVPVEAQSSPFRRGDVNEDGRVDLSDPVSTLDSLFVSGGAISCSDAADSNDDGAVDISDPVLTLSYLFMGSYSIPAPGPEDCGLDPSPDPLTCASYGALCAGSPVGVSTRLTFATTDQGLFGPDETVTRNVYPITNFFHEEVAPRTEGRILEGVDQDVPLEVLQSAWDRALATCTSRSYTRQGHSSCESVTISPTASECETGFIGTRTVELDCCVSPTDAWSNGCTFGATTRRTYTVALNIDLGGGIGPRPTRPAPRPFDVGMVATYEAAVDVGMEAEFVRGAGSVGVDYGTVATLEASGGTVPAGEVFTVTARHVPDPGAIRMESKYPQLAAILRYFIDARIKLEADYAYMNANTGEQVRTRTTVFNFDTARDPQADALGRLTGELVAVEMGLGGLELRLMQDVPFAPEEVRDLVWQIPPAIEFVVTRPFGCPLNIPVISQKLCHWPIPPISTDLFTIKLRAPQLDTPAVPGFDGGVEAFGSTTPRSPRRNQVEADGSVVNTPPAASGPS